MFASLKALGPVVVDVYQKGNYMGLELFILLIELRCSGRPS